MSISSLELTFSISSTALSLVTNSNFSTTTFVSSIFETFTWIASSSAQPPASFLTPSTSVTTISTSSPFLEGSTSSVQITENSATPVKGLSGSQVFATQSSQELLTSPGTSFSQEVSAPSATSSTQETSTSPAASQTMTSTPNPAGPGLSSSQTTSLSTTSTSTSTFDTTSQPSASTPSPPPTSTSSFPPSTVTSHSDLPSTSYSTTSLPTTPSVDPISSVTVTLLDGPTSSSEPQISITSIATSATAAFVTTGTEGVSTTTVESVVTTFFSSSALGGNVATETSFVVSPTLSSIVDSGNASRSLTKGAVAAVSVTMGLLAASIVVWAFITFRRRKKKQNIERDTTTAAMVAAGIIRAPPLDGDDVDEVPSISQRPQSVFQDGTPVTSAVDRDFGGPFNPYFNYPASPVLGNGIEQLLAPNSSQMVRSPSVPPPTGRVYRERIHMPSSQGHEPQSGSEPLRTSGSSRSYSPTAYPLLSGSFQPRDQSKQTSSEESYVPPMPPPHIFTSFAPPQYTSVQRGSLQQGSPISDRTSNEEAPALSSLDLHLEDRLRESDGSKGSVGLHDNEDYSPRPRLEIRNRTESQRTFGSDTSKTH